MSFPKYEKYRDSGVEWLGQVPAHWDTPRIKWIASFSGGGTPARENLEFWNGDIPWVSPKDMKFERIVGTEESITELGLQNSTASLVQPGRVLMVVRSGILKHTIPVATNEVVVALNQDMKALRFDNRRCDPRFFLRWVQGLNDRLLLAWAKQGATVESIEHSYLSETILPLPTRNEQSMIVSFLDRETAKIDDLIAEQQRLMGLLKEKRQAVIFHVVTKGLNPDAPMKPSGVEWLGEVPAHWEVIRLGRKIELQRGADITKDQQNSGDVPVVSSGGIASFHDTALVRGPGVVVGRKGTAGSLFYVDSDFWPHDTTLYVKDFGGNNPRFVFFKLSSMDLASFDTGSSNPTLNRNRIHPVVVSWPPISEQDGIACALDSFTLRTDALIAESQSAINLLNERRAALISAAVTGQIDVRALAHPAAA